ncbi:hypothetical protein [Flavobacterium psychrophilum]|uniref:hypothetical protein n=1 Tax=Flavobacterium psychrophilum TaxID=96345 RepID=UPI00193164EF|nr:hypothetical protein [Flavobacterium psychrophilum]QRE07152.1 hypothetical protein H0H27_02865 [Flavobacterium psychrophilum]QRE11928.1 hypothetical protein H0H30_02880 [Flavobacterium psychrophilum]QRE19158.1 hypothetical protein H0I43_02860 [Flavobacterium psychrophilum]QRE21546.1 hypothetical protein H0I44_02850 [Flavobacterium psychrophilum]QRE26330.1 hypothetical protein H0I46_02885 [Flavobacterium psychrophilum]
MMSKNAEIIAEILSEQVGKLEKLVTKQSEQTKEFLNSIERAETLSIKTDRLEEIIAHWNTLFEKQKQALQTLQKKQLTENQSV